MNNTIYIISVFILIIIQIYQGIQIRGLRIEKKALWIALEIFAGSIVKKFLEQKEEIDNLKKIKDGE